MTDRSQKRLFTSFRRSLALLMIVSSTVWLNGCSRYEVTLNEGLLYSPPGILTNFETASPILKNCFDQAIEEGKYTQIAQVTRLICTHAGLEDLSGIEHFYNLKAIDLGNNQIASLKHLQFLTKLETLVLDHNLISEASELLTLPALTLVDLRGNKALSCGDVTQLQMQHGTDLQVYLPEHCQQ